jgi:toxin YoeB
MGSCFAEAPDGERPFSHCVLRLMVERINKLIREIQREPFTGVGKPEALKHALSGFWSRRITDERRLVYRVEGDALLIAQLRFHY